MYKQVKFLSAFDDRILGGIGIFEDNRLIGIISGECGSFLTDDVLWYEVMEWIDISDAIIGRANRPRTDAVLNWCLQQKQASK